MSGEPISIEYAAAFIDADGSITVHTSGSGAPTWEVIAVQGIKNGNAPLVAMQKRWGGSLCLSSKGMWHFKTKGIEAAVMLKDIYPALRIKQSKARDALDYFEAHRKIGRILARIKSSYGGRENEDLDSKAG